MQRISPASPEVPRRGFFTTAYDMAFPADFLTWLFPSLGQGPVREALTDASGSASREDLMARLLALAEEGGEEEHWLGAVAREARNTK